MIATSSGPLSYLNALLHESYIAAQFTATSEGKVLPAWKNYALGSVVLATVSSIESYGIVLTGGDLTTMMLARGSHVDKIKEDKSVKVGQQIKVVVLDIDFKNRVLDVSIDNELIVAITTYTTSTDIDSSKAEKGDKSDKKKSKKKALVNSLSSSLLVKGSIVKGRVELVQSEGKYLVVSISKSVVAYVMVADYHCPTLNGQPSEYTEHQEVSLRVERPVVKGDGKKGIYLFLCLFHCLFVCLFCCLFVYFCLFVCLYI